jgi:hypothetical protein
MANKWMDKLNKMEGAVDKDYNPYAPENVIRSTSPSLNWTFAKGCGLPYGQTGIIYGPPKAGKSLISNLFIAGMHQANPDYIAVRFNTEMREGAQGDNAKWGIDENRFTGYDVNEPQLIFDRITNELEPMLKEGMPLKLIIIDSMEGIEGVKAANKESILDHTIGDHALTIGEGLKRILPIIRRNRIAVICTSHIRANLKMNGGHGPDTKMAGGYAQKHWFEYYMEVKHDKSADGKTSVDGVKFEDNDAKDFKGNKEKTGHKIWCKMAESSVGVGGRTGQITLDYNKGLINTYEEVFQLAKGLGLVERPNLRTYVVDGVKYTSKGDFARAIANDEELAKKIVQAAYDRDLKA